jgi:hypothetical protein
MRITANRLRALAVLAAVATFADPATADASAPPTTNTVAKIIGAKTLAPLQLGFSVGAIPALASDDAKTDEIWASRARRENTQIVRLDVFWNSVAPRNPTPSFHASNPGDPGYNWTQVDQQVRALSKEHFKILLTVQTAPAWAEGPHMPVSAIEGTWRPDAVDFGQFAHAIAERYDGSYPDPQNPGKVLPKIAYWQGWNEPNLRQYLSPQWIHSASTGYEAVSPGIYRRLANVFYKAVKAVSAKNYVVLAGLAPFGDDPSQMARMRPVEFERVLLCVTRALTKARGCPDPTYFDAIDSHPYGTIYGPNYHASAADDVSIQDVYKLVRVLHAAEKFGTALPRGKKGDWVTETSWDTKPPDPQGIPSNEEAFWLEQELYDLWAQGVSTVLWWQLADAPPIPSYASSYQAGTYYLHGAAKPGATAFRFPFVAKRTNKTTVVVWGRAPAAGLLAIQEKTGRRWQTLERVRVSAFQVFEIRLHLSQKETLRGMIGADVSLPWTQAGS